MPFYNQSNFEIRCEWGKKGVEQLAPISDAIIIVDILSFSTCIDLAAELDVSDRIPIFIDKAYIHYAG